MENEREEVVEREPALPPFTVLHKHSDSKSAWDDHTVWYHAAHFETTTTDAAVELVGNLGRIGITTITLPALSQDGDPHYIPRIMDKAKKRDLRILPNIGFDTMASLGREPLSADERRDLVDQWLRAGASGIELGNEHVAVDSGHAHAGQSIPELLAQVSLASAEALLSICLLSSDSDALTEHIHEDYFHVVRTAFKNNPLTPENLGEQFLEEYQRFDAAGTIPSWDLTHEILDLASDRLTVSAVVLILAAMPGIVNFTHGTMERSPSTRHLLRFRESMRLQQGSLALDTRERHRGIVSLIVDYLEVRINFGWDDDYLPNDGSVIASSRVELPVADDGRLVLPTGEVAWVSHTDKTRQHDLKS